MEHLRDFTFRLSPALRAEFKDFLATWEVNRSYYMFLNHLTDSPAISGGCMSVYDLEALRVVNSIETEALVDAIRADPEFTELASEDRYGPIMDVESLTIGQIHALIRKMSERSEIAFFNSDFEINNAQVESLL